MPLIFSMHDEKHERSESLTDGMPLKKDQVIIEQFLTFMSILLNQTFLV